MPESITDWLIQHGYSINEERRCFETEHYVIPFSAVQGAVSSFKLSLYIRGKVGKKEVAHKPDIPNEVTHSPIAPSRRTFGRVVTESSKREGASSADEPARDLQRLQRIPFPGVANG